MGTMTELQFNKEFSRWKSAAETRSGFDDDSTESSELRKAESKNSVWRFAELYFPEYVSEHRALFHEEWAGFAYKENSLEVIEAFRGAGKSTFFSFLDPVHRVVFGRDSLFVFASVTEDKSMMFTMRILAELLYNRRLAQDFGAFVLDAAKRGGKDFIVSHPTTHIRVQVKAVSIGQDPRGLVFGNRRPEVLRIDDPQTREKARSAKFVRKVVEWITDDMIPAMHRKYSAVMCATRVNNRDVLSVLEERVKREGISEIVFHKQAALVQGKAVWVGMSKKFLASQKRLIGTASFNQEYLLIPKPLDEQKFREAWIQRYKDAELPSSFEVVVSWTDPSAKKESQHDFKAVVVIGVSNAKGYVLDVWIRKASTGAMVDAMYDLYDKWNMAYMYWEDNGGQAILDEVFSMAAEKRGYYLPLKAMTNTVGKEQRIEQGLQARIEGGHIRFGNGDMQELLIDQLLQFPDGEHDDGPDALEGAVRMATGWLRRKRCGMPRSSGLRESTNITWGMV